MPASFNSSDTKLTRSSIPSTLSQIERLIISAAVSAKVQSRTGAAMTHYAPIDVHAHYFPQSFLDLIAKHGPSHGFEYKIVDGKGPQFKHEHLLTGPVGPKFVDLDARLEAMDEQGVEVQALSLSQPMVYWVDGELAQGISETYIDASGLPLFLHPVEVIGHQRLAAYYLTNLLGNPFESAIAAAHLIFGGVLDGFPKLVVCLPHAGGAFPWLVGRLNRGWEKRADLKHVKHSPLDYLRRFYYDTVGYSDHVLEYLVKAIGADRVLMGSDYCFPIAYERPVDVVTSHPRLDEDAKRKIVDGNARRLFKL